MSRIPTRGIVALGSPAGSVVKTTHPCAGLASQNTACGSTVLTPVQYRRTAATFVDSTAACVGRWEQPASCQLLAGRIIRQASVVLPSSPGALRTTVPSAPLIVCT